jgi:hypothetical protein
MEEYKYQTITVKGKSAEENSITKFHSLFGIIIRSKGQSSFILPPSNSGMQWHPN